MPATPAAPSWRTLLDHARWSPSPHNIQPWCLRVVSDREAELCYEPRRLLPDTDPTGRFMMSGFGSFVECLAVSASPEGWALDVEYDGRSFDFHATTVQPLARLRLSPASRPPEFDRALLRRRHTSRLAFDGRPAPPALVAELRAIAAAFGHDFQATDDPATVKWVLELNRDTLFYDLAADLNRNELSLWIRYSEVDERARRDGLSARCLDVPGWMVSLLFRHPRWFRTPVFYAIARRYYLGKTRGTRTVAWLRGPFESMPDAFQAGRMLARMWLAMTRAGVVLHPFGSIITNPTAHAIMRERLVLDESRQPTWLLFRMGYSAPPPQSLRREVDELLVEA